MLQAVLVLATLDVQHGPRQELSGVQQPPARGSSSTNPFTADGDQDRF